MVKGYKVFNSDWTCRDGFKYKVGETYTQDGKLEVCGNGLHFCKKAVDCFNYYSFDSSNHVAEVVAYGKIAEQGDKCCTNKLKVVGEISWQEVLNLVNTGDDNTGYRNTGSFNTGNFNTGYRNTGNFNTGDRNTGDDNTGNFNTGNRNTGYFNTGNRNTGDCNISNHETGVFCTEEHKIRIFDIESDITFEEWRDSRAYWILSKVLLIEWVEEYSMTDGEKSKHLEYKTTGGYLKKVDLFSAYAAWWKNLSDADKSTIKSIPNFNSKKFKIITGIEV